MVTLCFSDPRNQIMSRRMRFLFTLHSPTFGGPHNQAIQLYQPLLEAGWETIVALPDEPGNALQRFRDHGITVSTLPLSRLRSLKAGTHLRDLGRFPREIGGLRELIRQKDIDLVEALIRFAAAKRGKMREVHAKKGRRRELRQDLYVCVLVCAKIFCMKYA